MTSEESYGSWRALELATKEAAKKRSREAGPGVKAATVDAQIRQARFDRFLSRVFADGEQSGWMLKGGMSMLARVPASRTTKDVDLAAGRAADLAEAEAALSRAVDVDLGDHMTFRLIGSAPTGLGENQPGLLTRRYTFACIDTDTDTPRDQVHVDVVVGPEPVGQPEVVDPANRLRLGRPLVTHPYRLYPVTDQIADKVCATMGSYGEDRLASSRVKDLVDLVVLARTQKLDLDELRVAIANKVALSRVRPFERFRIPVGWSEPFLRAARGVPMAGGGNLKATGAEKLVAEMVDPALAPADGQAAVWVPGAGWMAPDDVAAAEATVAADVADGRDVYVREHWRADRGTAGRRRPGAGEEHS
ncbi:MAG: nucleotidyl transferase AbiEii/AbiGii toxin family protein [Nocardioides sp.]